MKRVNGLVAVTAFFLLSAAEANATSGPSSIQGLLDCERVAHGTLALFHRLQASPRDTGQQTGLAQSVEQLQQCADAKLPEAVLGHGRNGREVQAAALGLMQPLLSAVDDARAGRPVTGGDQLLRRYDELGAAFAMEEKHLLEGGKIDKQQTAYLVPKIVAELKALEVLYLERGKGTGAKRKQDIERLTAEVDGLMQSLQSKAGPDQTKWKPIQAAWWFTRKAALEQSDKSSPFIVSYQTDRLVGLLSRLQV